MMRIRDKGKERDRVFWFPGLVITVHFGRLATPVFQLFNCLEIMAHCGLLMSQSLRNSFGVRLYFTSIEMQADTKTSSSCLKTQQFAWIKAVVNYYFIYLIKKAKKCVSRLLRFPLFNLTFCLNEYILCGRYAIIEVTRKGANTFPQHCILNTTEEERDNYMHSVIYTKCVKAWRRGQEVQLFFRHVRMGNKCDLSDFDRKMSVGARQGSLNISETADLSGFSQSLEFAENGMKNQVLKAVLRASTPC